MAMHLIQYTRTEVTQNRVFVEADSLAEAVALVEEYEFDDSNEYQVQSFENTVSDVVGVAA